MMAKEDGGATLPLRASSAAQLPMFSSSDSQRPIAFRSGRHVLLGEFQQHVAAVARRLPAHGAMINLCEDRYRFLAAYAAALSVGHAVLLPPSRAEQILSEVQSGNSGSYRCDDEMIDAALERHEAASLSENRATAPVSTATAGQAGDFPAVTHDVPANQIAMIGYTSGSTGQPKSYPKLWHTVSGSSAQNALAIRRALSIAEASTPWILATVPPQHMYGMELSVLLPLLGNMAVHAGRPLFPADIAQALNELPQPRVLVSTPVHLRAIVESTQQFPVTALIISATAPLDRALAEAVERKLGGQLLEMFGSTETCVFARRRTAIEDAWQMYDEVELTARPDGTLVNAPWFVEPILLQDIVELQGERRFAVRGRNTDMIEVAGKRASLADLTRRLLAIDGVRDAVVFQPEQESVGTIRRVAALVVAPGYSSREILDRLAASVDPAFLPRPLLVVDSLPRNELGKLPRDEMLKLVRTSRR
jgi:acyl-coenzyme A synthetase/AMP-(fatty) acid ligase